MEPSARRVATPPPRPLMVWDGDCHFCGMWIRRWRGLTGDTVDYETSQSVGTRFPEVTAAEYARAVYLIMPDGRVLHSAEAVFEALACARHGGWGKAWYKRVPGFAPISEFLYRGVAGNRMVLSLLTRIFWGDPGVRSTYQFSGMLFLRMVGLIFLVAFLSFWAQAEGLVGDSGIIPIKSYYALLHAQPNLTNAQQFWVAPSLLWLMPSSAGLNLFMAIGSVCSLLLMAGVLPAWALIGCILTYGSLRGGVPVFLNYQWDALLVESGLTALLIAPWSWYQRPWSPREPPVLGRWAAWWLLFKLMFLSGLVKLVTNGPGAWPDHPNLLRRIVAYFTGLPIGAKIGDTPYGVNTWIDGTALQYHYFTQPIPGSTSWWFHHQSAGFQSTSLWACMFIELVVPFAFFAPRRLRHCAAVLQIFLQIALLVSGNYGFFNLLTIVLCIPLLDDTFWPGRVRRLLGRDENGEPAAPIWLAPRRPRIGVVLRGAAAGFILFVGLVQIAEAWQQRTREAPPSTDQPGFADSISMRMQQLGLINSYGLFRVMTTERPEIVVEGSLDGVNWKPYEFEWKPGDPQRQPSFSTPHMPRLDWQMWFAALDIYYSHAVPAWFPGFFNQLQQNNPAVLGLLANNPFPNTPPTHIRVVIYLYTFTSEEEHAKTGAWWTRTEWRTATFTRPGEKS